MRNFTMDLRRNLFRNKQLHSLKYIVPYVIRTFINLIPRAWIFPLFFILCYLRHYLQRKNYSLILFTALVAPVLSVCHLQFSCRTWCLLEVKNDGKHSNPRNQRELEEIGLLLLIFKGGGKIMDGLYNNLFDIYIGRLIKSLRPFVVYNLLACRYSAGLQRISICYRKSIYYIYIGYRILYILHR